MKLRRVLLVLKRPPLLPRNKRQGRTAQLRQLLEQGHDAAVSMELARDEHRASLRLVRQELRTRGVEVVSLTRVPLGPLRGFDLVITVGGDGTLLEASHVIQGRTPVLGVNSAPASSVGFLTGCRAPTFARTLDDLLADRLQPIVVARLRVRLGKKNIPEPVLNDVLFCHDHPAITTRYLLRWPGGEEVQRSSGLWIATPAGSTAALRSAGGKALPLRDQRFAFVIREPYASPGSTVLFGQGTLQRGQTLTIECRAAPASIFLDGSHRRYTVSFGETVTFSLHPQSLRLVRRGAGWSDRRR